jgi:hypothetical protein
MARKNVNQDVDDFDETVDTGADEAEENDEGKSPREKFVSAANRRYKVAVVRIRSLAKLHSKTYEYSEEEARRLIAAVQAEVDNMSTLLLTRPEREQSVTSDLFA